MNFRLLRLLFTPTAGIFCVGMALRVALAVWLGNPLAASDAGNYYRDALRLLHGEAYLPEWAPGLPLLLAAWIRLFGDSSAALGAFSLSWYGLFFGGMNRVGEIYKIPQKRINILHILFALYPTFIYQSIFPLTHLPIAALLLWSIVWQKQAFAGVLQGISWLIRPATGAVQVFLAGKSPQKWLLMCLPIGGWLLFVHQHTGQWQLNSTNEKNFFIGNNPFTPIYKTWWLGSHHAADTVAFNRYADSLSAAAVSPTAAAVAYIRAAPAAFVWRTASRVRTFFAFDIFAGAELQQLRPDVPQLYYICLLLDALCFCVLLVGAMLTFLPLASPVSATDKQLLWLIVLYALPYFFAFSHPTYHIGIIACIGLLWMRRFDCIFMIFQGTLLKNIKLSMLALLYLIIFIQLEWIYHCVMS